MTIQIELAPEEEGALLEQARLSGGYPAVYVRQILRDILLAGMPTGRDRATGRAAPTLEELIDDEAIASCEEDADDSLPLKEIRAATSKIKGSMARAVIEDERAERS
jgi:hypothetical protein